MMNFLSYLAGILLVLTSIGIIFTNKLPQGNVSMGASEVYIGNWAYLVGGILLIYGLYILYYMIIKKRKTKK